MAARGYRRPKVYKLQEYRFREIVSSRSQATQYFEVRNYLIFDEFRFIDIIRDQTDERYFQRPEEWLPERWSTKPHLIKDRAAFIPFSTGKSPRESSFRA